jgi:hypothetical protein
MLLSRGVRVLALMLIAVAVAGCGNKSGGGGGSTQIRFMNALVDGGAINVTVGTNNSAVVSGLAFEGITGYQGVDSGTQEFKVSVSGGTSTVIDQNIALSSDTGYTYVVYGTASAPLATILADTPATNPASGVFYLRVTNAAFGTAGLDLYVTTPGASLATASPNISNIAQNGTSGFATLNAGTLQVRFTLTNSKQVIYDSGTVTFNSQLTYEMVAYTKGSSTLVNAALFNVDSANTSTGALVNSKVAQFKVIHAAPGTGPINAFVDGSVALANIPYQGASSYGIEPSGTHTVTIETTAAPGAVIASTQPPFSPATDTSVVVTGTPGATVAVPLNDNNLPGSTGRARVRFANFSPNLGPVDVYVNFAPKVSGLATNAGSAYIELVEDTYVVNFDLAGTTTVVLNLPGVALTAGSTYTLYLVGTSDSLSGVLTRDD